MINMCNPSANDVRRFVTAVADMAITDWREPMAVKPRRTGALICQSLCSNWRGFHERMATGIYNGTMRTLTVSASRQPA